MQRLPWRIPLVLAVTVFVHYLDRNNLAIVLPQMAQEFGWDDRAIGRYGELVLGAFYLSFGLVQVFLSPYAERWGAKRSLIAAITGFSICTMLFYPLGTSLGAIIVLRLLLGAAESVHMPMNSAIVGQWFPPSHRGRANSLYVAGILLVLALAPWLIVPLAERLGWRATFLLLGAAGLLISIPLVSYLIPTSPPFRSPQPPPAPLSRSQLLTAYGSAQPRRFWLYTAAGALNAFCIFGMLNWLPTYLHRQRGIPFGGLSGPLFAIFLAGIVGIFFWAFWGDKTGRRITLASGGLFLAGACVWLTGFFGTTGAILLLLALGVFLQSSFNAQEFASLQGMVPTAQIGAATGLYNGLTVLVGGVGGSFIPGTIVSQTGSFQLGILSVAIGAWGVSGLLTFILWLEKHPRKS